MPTTPTDSRKQRVGRLARLSAEPAAALFAYGAMCFLDVLRTLLGRVPPSSSATASGWRVAALRERVYPALIPAESTASGLLLTGLTRPEWHTLDSFQDELYDLRCLTLDDGRQGWAYVTDHDPAVIPHDWDPDMFSRDALTAYLDHCRRWRHRFDHPYG